MKIALGADHAGFELKEAIKKYLVKNGYQVKDFGTYSQVSCDYPDLAYPVARSVAAKKFDRGILACGTGFGMAVAANRYKNIRAVNAYDEASAKQSREHGDCNILCLGGRKLSEGKALKIVKVWLETPFSGEERHRRRVQQLSQKGI